MRKIIDINNFRDAEKAIAEAEEHDADLMIYAYGEWWIYDDDEGYDNSGIHGIDSSGNSKHIKYVDIERTMLT